MPRSETDDIHHDYDYHTAEPPRPLRRADIHSTTILNHPTTSTCAARQTMAPSTFASAAAGNNQAPNSARDGNSEWCVHVPHEAVENFHLLARQMRQRRVLTSDRRALTSV